MIFTKISSFRSFGTFSCLLHAYIRNINRRIYVTSARGHELSGRVCANYYIIDAYNLIIMHRIIILPGSGPILYTGYVRMIPERHVVLKVVLHTKLAV